MKKVIAFLLIINCQLSIINCGNFVFAQYASSPAIAYDAQLEKKVEATMSRMSIDEKIGQMLQLNFDVFGHSQNGQWTFNEQKLDTTFSHWKIGSVLNTPGFSPSATQWREWIAHIQQKAMEHTGIPVVYGLDHNHGTSYVSDGTIFPQPINLAASFNTELVHREAEICAYESRAANCPWVFNPVLDLGRDPRWPRIWESFGEDATVNARMVEAEIRGYQGQDNNHIDGYHVATSVKHYFGYGAPFSGKDRTPAYIAPNMLREKYFEPFRAAIRAGALTIMVNSSSINGVPVHASYEYLTQWLKQDLNWDGMIVTDWADINNLYTREHVAKDKKDAIRLAINAGVDMCMEPYKVDFCTLLRRLVDEGSVSMDRIDDAVRRIIRLKYRLGLFDHPNTGNTKGDYSKFGSEEFARQALRTAEESEVLLKNTDGILPLKKGKKILLTGPNANQMRCLNGGWTYTWQGNNIEKVAKPYNTIYEALCNKYGTDNIILEQGVTYNEKGEYYAENKPEIQKAVIAAAEADVIVACIGENSYCETPGNLSDLWLSENQRNLVKELAKTGKPIILILNEGRPRLITDIEPLAKAIINILLPGNYGGDALANLMAGDTNFSAKMPYTYPREINSLCTYDYKVCEETGTMDGAYNYDAKVPLLWPFGYGLSYTTFQYSNLRVDKTSFRASDTLTVKVDVRNTGKFDGKEAVLLYSSDLVASVVPDNKRLRAFSKTTIPAGETKTVTFSLPASELAFVGADGKWVLEEGDFTLHIGNLSARTACSETYKWETPNR